jgi:hypothetical protein
MQRFTLFIKPPLDNRRLSIVSRRVLDEYDGGAAICEQVLFAFQSEGARPNEV